MLSVERVSKNFGVQEGTVVALHDVSLDVVAGSYTAVMGPSGCGKSTLLTVAGGLQPPDEGLVKVGGVDLYALSDDDLHVHRRRSVGFVFQDFNLIPILTADENVSLPLELDGVSVRVARKQAREVLDRLGVGALASRLPATLSGGQIQRVAVARAIVAGQDVVLADEPTGALDSHSTAQLLDVFDTLVGEGVTVVVVTHDEAVASRAQQIVRMRDGRILQTSVR